MVSYNYTFDDGSIPPSGASFAAITLSASAEFVWPYSYTGSENVISKIMEITCSAGVVMTMPSAKEVSVGEDFLVRNVGSNLLTIHDNAGGTIGTVAAGAVLAVYLKDNSTVAGTWGSIAYGVGTSSIDASTLAGAGIYPIASSLNSEFAVYAANSGFTVTTALRAQLINYTGGVGTIAFDPSATLGDGFFVLIRNSGTGTLTLEPYDAELIDGVTNILLQPGESSIVGCNSSTLMTVGLGRSTEYQFTQLTKDLTGLASYTLTPIEAANKLLTFIGSPAAALNVVVPNVVAVYYVYNALSVNKTITVKTGAGGGAAVTQGGRAILFCDGTAVFAAQTVTVTGSVPMPDGTSSAPGLYFAAEGTTGFYRPTTNQLGVAVNGAMSAIFGTSGLITAAAGNLTSTTLNAALNELQLDIDTRATPGAITDHAALTVTHGVTGAIVGTTNTQTLTAKTLTTPVLSGTASGTTAGRLGYSAGVFTYGNGSVQRVVVNTDEAQTLTNKTLTSPVINTPTGIVKGDVGLGNVDNTSDATKNAAVATLTNKTLTAPVINGTITTTGLTMPAFTSGAINSTTIPTSKTIVVTTDINTSVQAYDVDTAKLDVEQTWTAQQTPMNGSLTFGAPTAWNCDTTGQVAYLLTGGSNFTLSNPTNIIARTSYMLIVEQGATARVITWDTNYLFPGGVEPLLTATAAAIDIFTFVGTSAGKMLCVGIAKGLA